MPEAARTAAGQQPTKSRTSSAFPLFGMLENWGFRSMKHARFKREGETDQSCDEDGCIALRHLRAVDERISRLQALRSELRSVVAACTGGEVSECKSSETLSETQPPLPRVADAKAIMGLWTPTQTAKSACTSSRWKRYHRDNPDSDVVI